MELFVSETWKLFIGAATHKIPRFAAVDLNPEEVANGMRDAAAVKAKLTEQEVRDNLMAWQQEIRGKRTPFSDAAVAREALAKRGVT